MERTEEAAAARRTSGEEEEEATFDVAAAGAVGVDIAAARTRRAALAEVLHTGKTVEAVKALDMEAIAAEKKTLMAKKEERKNTEASRK